MWIQHKCICFCKTFYRGYFITKKGKVHNQDQCAVVSFHLSVCFSKHTMFSTSWVLVSADFLLVLHGYTGLWKTCDELLHTGEVSLQYFHLHSGIQVLLLKVLSVLISASPTRFFSILSPEPQSLQRDFAWQCVHCWVTFWQMMHSFQFISLYLGGPEGLSSTRWSPTPLISVPSAICK